MTPGSVIVGYCDAGSWSACFGLSLRDLMLHDLAGPRRIMRPGGVEIRVPVHTGRIHDGRNRIVREFLAADGEWLLMLDTDMGFAPDTADALVASADPIERPVMGGLCFALEREPGPLHGELWGCKPTVYELVADVDGGGFRSLRDYPRDQVVRVDGTGAACLLLHRAVLEEMRSAGGETWFDPVSVRTPSGRVWFGEDLSLCLRLREAGVPVHVNTKVKTTHHKGGLYLDEELFDWQGATGGAG